MDEIEEPTTEQAPETPVEETFDPESPEAVPTDPPLPEYGTAEDGSVLPVPLGQVATAGQTDDVQAGREGFAP